MPKRRQKGAKRRHNEHQTSMSVRRRCRAPNVGVSDTSTLDCRTLTSVGRRKVAFSPDVDVYVYVGLNSVTNGTVTNHPAFCLNIPQKQQPSHHPAFCLNIPQKQQPSHHPAFGLSNPTFTRSIVAGVYVGGVPPLINLRVYCTAMAPSSSSLPPSTSSQSCTTEEEGSATDQGCYKSKELFTPNLLYQAKTATNRCWNDA